MSSPAIIFDLDGTLVDSIPTVAAILNQMRQEAGKSLLPLESFYPWISLGGLTLVSKSLQTPADATGGALVTFRKRYLAHDSNDSLLYPGVVELLQQLCARELSLAICTNKPRALVNRVLKRFDMAHYFRFILAGDDLSTQKPDSRNLACCMDALGATPQHTVFVGDSRVDQACAHNALVRFAFFSGGYDDGVDREAAWQVFAHHQEFNPSFATIAYAGFNAATS